MRTATKFCSENDGWQAYDLKTVNTGRPTKKLKRNQMEKGKRRKESLKNILKSHDRHSGSSGLHKHPATNPGSLQIRQIRKDAPFSRDATLTWI